MIDDYFGAFKQTKLWLKFSYLDSMSVFGRSRVVA